MKIQIKCSNNCLKILLQQYFSNLEITETAPISILESNSSFHIISNDLKQDWHINYPAPILSIINILTQAQQSLEKNVIKIGEVVFHPNKRICIFKEEEIPLTQKETEILLFLSKQENYVDKTTLLEKIWGYSSGISTHTLETHIYKLRSKFVEKCELIASNEEGYKLLS